MGRVNHSLEAKVGVRKPEITSVLSIVMISICEKVFLQVPDNCGNTVLYLCRGTYMHLLNLSGYEHYCVCISFDGYDHVCHPM